MANINFYLRKGQKNKAGEQSIIMRITYNMNRTIIFLNSMVNPKYWLQKKQMVRAPHQREAENNYVVINEKIQVYRQKAEDAINYALKNDIVLNDAYFKNWFADKQVKKNNPTEGFFELFDKYIEAGRSHKAERTITGYTTVKNFLKSFEKDSGQRIDLNAINLEFFDELQNYAFLNKKIQDNYFAKILNVLKSFLSWAKDRGARVNEDFRRFKTPEREKEIIFLTIDELMKLYNHEFESPRLDRARDIYCFGCFTGLRISDIMELEYKHITDESIEKVIKKTRIRESIPLNKFAKQILQKYEGRSEKPLPAISTQKLNQYIKECCEIAEIDSPITITKFSGKTTEEITLPKHELITSHTARKTFLTNSIILGMNYMAARGISGHKRDRNFNKYVKIAEDFKKKEMEKTWDGL